MTPPEPLDYGGPPRRPARTALYWVGFLVMVFGSAFSGASIANQLKNSDPGTSYYGWLAVGALCFVAGVGLMIAAKRRTS
jgi:hypothetical protein